MSETSLIQPMSQTAGLDAHLFKKLNESMDLFENSGLQNLQLKENTFEEDTGINYQLNDEKPLIYENEYNHLKNIMGSLLGISIDVQTSQIKSIYFDEINWEQYSFQLVSQLKLDIEFTENMWKGENEELEIFLVEDSINDLKSIFQEEFFVMWQVYSQEPDEKLTNKAKQIKNKIMNIIGCVKCGCDQNPSD